MKIYLFAFKFAKQNPRKRSIYLFSNLQKKKPKKGKA